MTKPHEHEFTLKTVDVLAHGKSKRRFKDTLKVRVCECGESEAVDIKERKVF